MSDVRMSDIPTSGVSMPEPDLSVDLAGLRLSNPVMVASGTFGFGREYEQHMDVRALGAIVVKGLTLERRPGNPPVRICETPSGLLNCIGLQNPGLAAYLEDELPHLRGYGIPIVANIAGNTPEEYGKLASELERCGGADALEVNVSCPNVKQGGMAFGVDPGSTAAVVAAVRRQTALPLIVKLSPNVTDIVAMARSARGAGADAVSLINTLLGMAIDVRLRRPVLSNVFGGLSGPAVRPVAVRMVWQVYEAVDIPIVGMGGIMTATDAIEFILAGAKAVAVGTGNFVDPMCACKVIDGIRAYMKENGFERIGQIVGAAHSAA